MRQYGLRMEFNGLPLHPLIIHAAVVFVPLAATCAILFVVPKWRWLLRWPTLVLSVASLVFVQVSIMSGENLKEARGLDTPQIDTHEQWAGRLRIAVIVLTILVVLAVWAFGYATRLAGGADREAKVPVLEKPLMALLPIAGVATLALVFLTGDAGSRAVWG